jgi:hypothetical protein
VPAWRRAQVEGLQPLANVAPIYVTPYGIAVAQGNKALSDALSLGLVGAMAAGNASALAQLERRELVAKGVPPLGWVFFFFYHNLERMPRASGVSSGRRSARACALCACVSLLLSGRQAAAGLMRRPPAACRLPPACRTQGAACRLPRSHARPLVSCAAARALSEVIRAITSFSASDDADDRVPASYSSIFGSSLAG